MNYIKVPIKEERLGQQGMELLFTLRNIAARTKCPTYICGGFARYCASPLDNPPLPRDIDIYASTHCSFNEITQCINKGAPLYKFSSDYENVKLFGKDIVHFVPKESSGFIFPVQVMSPKFGNTVDEVLDGFDFSICRAAIISNKEALVDPEFIDHETRRRLILRTNPQPKNLLARTLKYINKGYFVPSALHLIQLIGLAKDMKQEELKYIFRYAYSHKLLEGMFGGDLANMYESLMEDAK